jgi:spore coat polysaccharide biosynthesis protein SpsF
MKTGFFLTARLGSKRLARKHLLKAAGRPLLSVLAGRIRRAFAAPIERCEALIAVVTSDEPVNRDFEHLGGGLRVFYGATHNIPLRHLEAAQALGVDAIVAVDGDDILCSVEAMGAVRDAMLRGAPYVGTSGLPLGMNAFGYRTEFLSRSMAGNEGKTLETGWTYIFDASQQEKLALDTGVVAPENLRFTLDYAEDYEFFRRIVEHFGTVDDREIVSYVTAEGLQRITDPIAGKYRENFQSERAKEMSRG